MRDWLQEQTELDVVLPKLQNTNCKLIGGRKCKIDGRSAAFAAYEMNGVPTSLVVVVDAIEQLDGMVRMEHSGSTHWVDRLNEHTVVACRRGALVYAAVSPLPERELLCLMTAGEARSTGGSGAVHESD